MAGRNSGREAAKKRRPTVRSAAKAPRSRRPRRPVEHKNPDEDLFGSFGSYADEALYNDGYSDDDLYGRYADDDRSDSYADEDMLAEFSDETNEFYTDEHSMRERRRSETAKNGKKPEKKPEKRKPISPFKRKVIHIVSYTAIISVVLIVGVILSLTVLFKTQVYEINGNTRYDEEAIVEACGIGTGENIFLAPKKPAEQRIKDKFPYVESVDVTFKIPDTIKITIEEAVQGYLIRKNDTAYYVISTKGRILEEVNDPSAYDLPLFIGPTLMSGSVGDYVTYQDDKVVDMIESITQTFADNGYIGITEIDATDMADISFTYDDRIIVKLGIPEDLDYKIRTAMTIINENLDKNQTNKTKGILDVSRCNSTKRSYFNEQEIHPTEAPSTPVKPTTAPSDDDWSDDDYYDDGYWEEDDDWDYEEYDWSDDGYDGEGYYE